MLASQLEFLVGVHGLRRVILIAHEGCAFYAERLGTSPTDLVTRQHQDLLKAAERVHGLHAELVVEAYFARCDDGTFRSNLCSSRPRVREFCHDELRYAHRQNRRGAYGRLVQCASKSMALPVQIDSSGTPRAVHPRQQGLPTALLVLLLISVLATGGSVAAFFVPGAVVSAFFVAVVYGMIVTVRLRQRRAWAQAVMAQGADPTAREGLDDFVDPEHDLEEISPDVAEEVVAAERAGFRMGVFIVAPLVVLAVVLAAVFVGWNVIGLGALAFFAIMIFMGGPVWLAAMEEEIDDDQEKIGVETHRIH